MTIKPINLQAIRIDGGTQSRVALNLDTVAEYREVLKAGTELPPVKLFFDGTDYWMADGFHRHGAYTEEERASIPADVVEGTKRDALLYSCGANAQHGLRRTRDDKRNSVMMMLSDAEWGQLSNREIAEHCRVSHTFVNTLRVAMTAPPPTSGPEGGNVSTPPKPPAPPPNSGPEAGSEAASPKPPAPPPPPPPAEAPPPGPSESERAAEDAHGDSDLAQLLEETQADLAAAQAQLQAAAADDLKAEAMKWQRLSAIATNRQNELAETNRLLMIRVGAMHKSLERIGKAVGEEDFTKIAATVEMFVRTAGVTA